MSIEPNNGEWWMTQSTRSGNRCPMLKVDKGWVWVSDKDDVPKLGHMQSESGVEPLYKMVKE